MLEKITQLLFDIFKYSLGSLILVGIILTSFKGYLNKRRQLKDWVSFTGFVCAITVFASLFIMLILLFVNQAIN